MIDIDIDDEFQVDEAVDELFCFHFFCCTGPALEFYLALILSSIVRFSQFGILSIS
jgi:hypothetical protein